MSSSPFRFDQPCDPPLQLVEVEAVGDHRLPDDLVDRIGVYTPHDGGAIPAPYHRRADGAPLIDPEVLQARYVEMRDWGANLVAEHLASALGLRYYARCRIARVLLDFNRFPGVTPPNTDDPLAHLAINHPFIDALDHPLKTTLLEHYDQVSDSMEQALLERYYDRISVAIERVLANSLIGIAIHTYDETHASDTKRADLSLISLPLSYQREARLTYGVFDPMYPDDLAESTCSRILRDRVSLNLERSGFRVTHNHPYPAPDGAIETRSQVWHFFRYVRLRFEADHPETKGAHAYERVWTMLLDTNLRLAEAEALRSYLHRFRRVREEKRGDLLAALSAYRHVQSYVGTSEVITDYRRSHDRPSSLGIEIRKDLVCTFDPETGFPHKPNEEQRNTARRIASAIAGAIMTYIDTDRPAYVRTSTQAPGL